MQVSCLTQSNIEIKYSWILNIDIQDLEKYSTWQICKMSIESVNFWLKISWKVLLLSVLLDTHSIYIQQQSPNWRQLCLEWMDFPDINVYLDMNGTFRFPFELRYHAIDPPKLHAGQVLLPGKPAEVNDPRRGLAPSLGEIGTLVRLLLKWSILLTCKWMWLFTRSGLWDKIWTALVYRKKHSTFCDPVLWAVA